MNNENRFYTLNEAAKELGIDPGNLHRKVKKLAEENTDIQYESTVYIKVTIGGKETVYPVCGKLAGGRDKVMVVDFPRLKELLDNAGK